MSSLVRYFDSAGESLLLVESVLTLRKAQGTTVMPVQRKSIVIGWTDLEEPAIPRSMPFIRDTARGGEWHHCECYLPSAWLRCL